MHTLGACCSARLQITWGGGSCRRSVAPVLESQLKTGLGNPFCGYLSVCDPWLGFLILSPDRTVNLISSLVMLTLALRDDRSRQDPATSADPLYASSRLKHTQHLEF